MESPLLICALALAPIVAPAAEVAVSDRLDEVVVNATRSDTQLQDMPLHTTIITHEQIENSPATSVDQLLRQVPGLLIPGAPFYTTDPTGNNITFRGLSKKVLVLVLFARHFGPVAEIPRQLSKMCASARIFSPRRN